MNITWLLYGCFGSYVAIEAHRYKEMRDAVSLGRIVMPSEATAQQAIQSWQRDK